MEDISFDEAITLNDSRAATYDLIARLYRVEVDEDLLAKMKETRFPAKTGDEQVDKGYHLIAGYLGSSWENSLTELAADYFRTFYGQGVDSYSAAHPFESVYTSPKRLLMQEARDEVLAIYRSVGLNKAEEWKEGEDHIALELEYLKVLCERISAALAKGDEQEAVQLFINQRNFLDDHVLSWVPMFTQDMRRFAQTDFYQGLAELTDGFLSVDRQFIDDVLDEN